MMRIEPSTALAAGLSLVLFFFLGTYFVLAFLRKKEESPLVGGRRARQCPYCAHLFFDASKKSIVICPVCNSYLEVENEAKEKA